MEAFEKRVLMSPVWRVVMQRGLLPWVLRVGELQGEAQVLELGSGAGFGAERLLSRFSGWEVTATDYDAEVVRLLRARVRRFGERTRVTTADATAIPFPDQSFDI